ncbi:5-formyltetrahydrofolate cyclo-ligase [Caulobacter sp. 17J80-11]|uniref:5-formyltetrahydrofolate cyclo-ligase n=1 Tax=Caulobacter sp. 17J80-11 TaxID=2763502 RepID=UPI0016535AE2|nr:5-formyltetrahydrofolate cyclo-ligase [Caulobacter sp. 17J80-11]MBC6980287.1 5-formyltetrahydrofolate cyclo-ligase [Caulobacter sp. 17J80-11]
MTDFPDPKSAARADAAEARARAFALNPMAGETAAALFPAFWIPAPGAVVAGYWPFRTEIDPRPLMRRLMRLGARAALPATPPRGSHDPLTFRLWRPEAELAPGHFKVHEPLEDAPVVVPDLVIVPLLAFDRFGGRLGYGAGHFDRTLEALRAFKPVVAVGLAYAAQEIDQTPLDAHDQKLDGVVTELGYIAVREDD